jgi:hypothetical protein
MAEIALRCGAKIKEEEFYRRAGLEVPKPGEPVIEQAAPEPAFGGGPGFGSPFVGGGPGGPAGAADGYGSGRPQRGSSKPRRRAARRASSSSLMWPPTGTATANDPMLTLESMAREMEARPGIASVSVVAGFSFADTEHTGVSFVASGTDDAKQSRPLREGLHGDGW